MFDVIFLSYDEPSADNHFKELLKTVPYAKRVHGVRGIKQAHIEAAKLSTTDMFFVVDADTYSIDATVFDTEIPSWDRNYTHIWYAENIVNRAVYGYGGIKCFNTKQVLESSDIEYVDFSTSVGELKVIPKCASQTKIDSSAYITYRSVVREIVKLTLSPQSDVTRQRLELWETTTPNTHHLVAYYLGIRTAEELATNPQAGQLINDYNYLQDKWAEYARYAVTRTKCK